MTAIKKITQGLPEPDREIEAIVLAGGFGTRLREVVNDVPKSMALVNGRPFLEYLLDYLATQKIERVVLSVGYKYEFIRNHFGNSYRTLEIAYSVENEPMGTGGGIRLSFWKILGPRAIVLNGDSIFRVDFADLYDNHLKKKADVTIALRKLANTGRYGRVELNKGNRILAFEEKNESAGPGFINAGVYVMEKAFLMDPVFRGKFSIEQDCFGKYHETSRMFGRPLKGYFLDIGIPEDYQKAQHDFTGFEDR